jgi:Zn-finger nucleic acid-binding protein
MRLTCPACQGELAVHRCEVSSLEIDCCFTCRGLWFDRNELRRFFSSPKLYQKFRLPELSMTGKKMRTPPGPRNCPRCPSHAMPQVTLADVVVEECDGCKGIWLDSGEITRLIELYEKKQLSGKSETLKQIRKGKFDRTPVGQVSHMVKIAFKMLF